MSQLTTLFFLLLLLTTTTTTSTSINITQLLSPYPSLSQFSTLLTNTAVSSDLTSRTSITVLTVPNSFLHLPPSSTALPDTLRYHILLQYLTLSDLHNIPPSGKQVTTLLQTTGRSSTGTMNITYSPESSTVTFFSPTSNATLLSSISSSNSSAISILSLNSLLTPYNLDLMASETRPPFDLNITKALIDGHDFNVAASMLSASGVVSEFENAATGAGITLFIPTDEAFADLPSSVKFQSLPADSKATVLRFHVLHSYYPLGTLEDIVNPTYPTLATETSGAGSFTLNISRVNGTLSIGTGLVQAFVTQTVFDQKPVAIFGVSKVLLPREYFGKNPSEMNVPAMVVGTAQPPSGAYSPGNSPPNHLAAAPPGMEVRSHGGSRSGVGWFLGVCCIGVCYLLL